MDVSWDSNTEELQAAGLITGDIPDAHREALDSLTGPEVAALKKAYQLLSDADLAEGHESIAGERPTFASFIVL